MSADAHPPNGVGHELSDVHVPSLVKGLIVLAVLVVVSVLLMAWMFRGLAARSGEQPPAPLMAPQRVLPPTPRLQVNPTTDLVEMRATQQQRLSTYGWVDRKAGVVRIPVDRAMELMAQRAEAAK